MSLRNRIIAAASVVAVAFTALAPFSQTKAQPGSGQATALNWINPRTLLPRSEEFVDPRLRPRYRELLDTFNSLAPLVQQRFSELGQKVGGFSTPEAVLLFQTHPETVILGSNIFIFNGLNNTFRFPTGIAHFPLLDPRDPHNKGLLYDVLDLANKELGLPLPPRSDLTTVIDGIVTPNAAIISALLGKMTAHFHKNGFLVHTEYTLPPGPIGGLLSIPSGEICAERNGLANCAISLPAATEATQLVNLLAFAIFQKQQFQLQTKAGHPLSYQTRGTLLDGKAADVCTFQSPQFQQARPNLSRAPDTYGSPITRTTKSALEAWMASIADPALSPNAPSNTGKTPYCFHELMRAQR
jgi:hypothetical protein